MLKSRRVENGSLACLIIGLLSAAIISIISYEFLQTTSSQSETSEEVLSSRRRLSNEGGAGVAGGVLLATYLATAGCMIGRVGKFDSSDVQGAGIIMLVVLASLIATAALASSDKTQFLAPAMLVIPTAVTVVSLIATGGISVGTSGAWVGASGYGLHATIFVCSMLLLSTIIAWIEPKHQFVLQASLWILGGSFGGSLIYACTNYEDGVARGFSSIESTTWFAVTLIVSLSLGLYAGVSQYYDNKEAGAACAGLVVGIGAFVLAAILSGEFQAHAWTFGVPAFGLVLVIFCLGMYKYWGEGDHWFKVTVGSVSIMTLFLFGGLESHPDLLVDSPFFQGGMMFSGLTLFGVFLVWLLYTKIEKSRDFFGDEKSAVVLVVPFCGALFFTFSVAIGSDAELCGASWIIFGGVLFAMLAKYFIGNPDNLDTRARNAAVACVGIGIGSTAFMFVGDHVHEGHVACFAPLVVGAAILLIWAAYKACTTDKPFSKFFEKID